MALTDRLSGVHTSLAVKAPCKAVSNAALTLSGEQTVGGVACVEGDRVLVKDQSDTIENGIYDVSTSTWLRAADFDGSRDVGNGTLVLVYNDIADGVLYQVSSNDDEIVIGESEITFGLRDDPAVTYPQTQTEIDAGATPSNFSKLPSPLIDVTRYGATGDGVTNDAAAFQAAIDVAKQRGGTVVVPPAASFYLIEDALDCTFPDLSNQRCFTMVGLASASVDLPHIKFKHTGHGFDCAGSDMLRFQDLVIGTDASTYPKTCFFLARNTTGSNSQIHRFDNVMVAGKFSKCILYNYGSEDGQYKGCYWKNSAADAAAKCVVITATNILALSSTFITITTGSQSCIDHQFIGGQFMMDSDDAAADVFYLDNATAVKLIGPWMRCFSASGGRALVYVNTVNGGSDFLTMIGVTGEQGNEPAYGIYVGDTVRTPTNWTILGCTLPNATKAIAAHANVTMSEPNILNIWEQTSHGISIPGTLDGGSIDVSVPLTIGTARWARLCGFVENWTVTTYTDCAIQDRTITSTWTPDTGNLTVVGALTVTHNRFNYQGKYLEAQFLMFAGTSIVCAAGITVGGLPRAAKDSAGEVVVINQDTPALIGYGYVAGTDLVLPAINAGTEAVIVRARYRIA